MPCDAVTLPKGQKKEAVIYDEAQAQRFIRAAKGTEMELVIDIELCLGLRRGELLGLQWCDIDWGHNKLTDFISIKFLSPRKVEEAVGVAGEDGSAADAA